MGEGEIIDIVPEIRRPLLNRNKKRDIFLQVDSVRITLSEVLLEIGWGDFDELGVRFLLSWDLFIFYLKTERKPG